MERYNRNPEGWRVLTDFKGNVLILGPTTGYRLKLIPLNPNEYTGVGARIGDLSEVRKAFDKAPPYGFRPLSGEEFRELLETFHQDGTVQEEILKRLLGVKPVPLPELQGSGAEAVLSGPIITRPDLSLVSDGQKELEMRLSKEADKLFRMRYPHRTSFYI
ncbi:MAG: hypothetical protein QW390_00140, partial [Candidatus Bathyarchaeia archaeon]